MREFPPRLIFTDVETTGLYPGRDRVGTDEFDGGLNGDQIV